MYIFNKSDDKEYSFMIHHGETTCPYGITSYQNSRSDCIKSAKEFICSKFPHMRPKVKKIRGISILTDEQLREAFIDFVYDTQKYPSKQRIQIFLEKEKDINVTGNSLALQLNAFKAAYALGRKRKVSPKAIFLY